MEKDAYLEAFARELARLLVEPSEELPSARCLSRRVLYGLFNQVRETLKGVGARRTISQADVLGALVRLSILRPLPVHGNGEKVKGGEYYAVGFEPTEKTDVDPKELLQAAVPEGVICYFTALNFHDLTTQVPAHHHIAKTREDLRGSRGPTEWKAGEQADGTARSYSRMGRKLFRYQGTTYYWTTRSTTVLRAFRSWQLNPKLIVRVVTLEQALVDTLHKPVRCGGPSVVHEAWEEAVEGERLRQADLAKLLHDIGSEGLTRKVGYILAGMGVELEAELRRVTEVARRSANRNEIGTATLLMPDYSCTEYDEDWHLMVPEW